MLIKIYPENPSEKFIRQTVDCLRNDGIVIFPTDTIYALGCNIYSPKAIDKIARIKGVKKQKANFSFLFYDLSQLSDYTKPINNDIFKIMRRNLPGPFTFILEANNNVPKIFHNKKKTVGIRIPDNNIIRQIIQELGNPMMSTSIHDDDDIIEYTTDPELIFEKYDHRVDIVINGGYGDNEPSTIIDCTSGETEVVREGKGILEF